MDNNLEKKEDEKVVEESITTEETVTDEKVQKPHDETVEKKEEKTVEKTAEEVEEPVKEISEKTTDESEKGFIKDEDELKEEVIEKAVEGEVITPQKKDNKFGFVKFMWKIIKTILVVILALVLAVIVVQRVSKNKATIGGYGIYTIVSESMVPEYNIWDMLFAKKVAPEEIKIGDDVVYQGKEGDFVDKIVTHRVIKKTRHGNSYTFVTKGIANPVEDPEISADQIYGKVVLKSVVLTTISKVINTTYGFYFIIFVPFVVIVTLEIIDTVNERKRLKRS